MQTILEPDAEAWLKWKRDIRFNAFHKQTNEIVETKDGSHLCNSFAVQCFFIYFIED